MKIPTYFLSSPVLRRFFGSSILVLAILLWPAPGVSGHSQRDQTQSEEAEDYFKKWLEEDVLYIITDEEKDVFESLTTPEEKENFIEQFWKRRDSDPSHFNEFKEEHYRRIAYANEHFHSGVPGWRTDRGKIYIIHGPPDEREIHLAGETYRRSMREGGGSTRTYPFEMWRYRHIDGIGDQVVLEFVDRTLDSNYVLALDPDEKDALMYAPTLGMTMAEEMGLASRGDRPYFNPGNRFSYPLMNRSMDDTPFARLYRYSMVQAPKELKYKDLERFVDVNVSFETLPVKTRTDFLRLNDEQVLALITVELENRDLTFRPEGVNQVARVALYGIVTRMTNEVETRFEDDLITSGPAGQLVALSMRRSIYQKIVPLSGRWRYKLDLVVKDVQSEKVGVLTTVLIPPSYDQKSLGTSSLILSDFVKVLPDAPTEAEMFVLGDVKVRPTLKDEFLWFRPLYAYLQVYNSALDQSLLQPSLLTQYRILRDGRLLEETTDETGESIHYFSGRRVVLLKEIKVEDLTAGSYKLEIEVQDRISGQRVKAEREFQVIDPSPAQEIASN